MCLAENCLQEGHVTYRLTKSWIMYITPTSVEANIQSKSAFANLEASQLQIDLNHHVTTLAWLDFSILQLHIANSDSTVIQRCHWPHSSTQSNVALVALLGHAKVEYCAVGETLSGTNAVMGIQDGEMKTPPWDSLVRPAVVCHWMQFGVFSKSQMSRFTTKTGLDVDTCLVTFSCWQVHKRSWQCVCNLMPFESTLPSTVCRQKTLPHNIPQLTFHFHSNMYVFTSKFGCVVSY